MCPVPLSFNASVRSHLCGKTNGQCPCHHFDVFEQLLCGRKVRLPGMRIVTPVQTQKLTELVQHKGSRVTCSAEKIAVC